MLEEVEMLNVLIMSIYNQRTHPLTIFPEQSLH